MTDETFDVTGKRMIFCTVLVLQVTGLCSAHITTAGDAVTLPCGLVKEDVVPDCGGFNWTHDQTSLVEFGQNVAPDTHRNRVSLTEICSLTLTEVRVEDVGLYFCKTSNEKGWSSSAVHLAVVTITEQTVSDQVTLTCSVFTFSDCRYSVRWVSPPGVDKDTGLHSERAGFRCWATATWATRHLTSREKQSWRCSVASKDLRELFESEIKRWPGERTEVTTE
ncbi:uncharacterized protein LOC112487200 [Cynoglossus semilaevis]|uniref:uncharacterized protein LOC112487200 n=1 Tax=Cynoglossus semilaevis TaxID=244447 RepID=UPI000D62CB04|nr:uncharacterized protein LOC112487200 [Cynoglossus semilaevis]XP_024912569.1 uncharacterized protein LOC112487200 [Cynoglossus semilaevis]